MVCVAVPAVKSADVIDFAFILVDEFLHLCVAQFASFVIVEGRNAVTHEMPRTSVNKEAVGLGLLFEPSENFVFFDGQVVAVVHDVLVEVLLVMECPTGKDDGCDEYASEGAFGILFLAVHRSCKILDHVRDGECGHKCHGWQHHETVTLVDFNAEIAGNVLENDVRLNVVQEQETENLEVGEVALSGIVDGAEDEVDGSDYKEVVEVAEERIAEFSVVSNLHGHHFPVLGEVFEEVSMCRKLTALETKALEIADGEEDRDRK